MVALKDIPISPTVCCIHESHWLLINPSTSHLWDGHDSHFFCTTLIAYTKRFRGKPATEFTKANTSKEGRTAGTVCSQRVTFFPFRGRPVFEFITSDWQRRSHGILHPSILTSRVVLRFVIILKSMIKTAPYSIGNDQNDLFQHSNELMLLCIRVGADYSKFYIWLDA